MDIYEIRLKNFEILLDLHMTFKWIDNRINIIG